MEEMQLHIFFGMKWDINKWITMQSSIPGICLQGKDWIPTVPPLYCHHSYFPKVRKWSCHCFHFNLPSSSFSTSLQFLPSFTKPRVQYNLPDSRLNSLSHVPSISTWWHGSIAKMTLLHPLHTAMLLWSTNLNSLFANLHRPHDALALQNVIKCWLHHWSLKCSMCFCSTSEPVCAMKESPG
jgi:hypothetical protein